MTAMTASTDFATLPGNTFVANPAARTDFPPPPASRHDVYVAIHKALREFMAQTLASVGRMDADDADERANVLGGVDALLGMLRSHLQHENDFIHTAIEARRPGGAHHTAEDHACHLDAIANLEDESRALRDVGDHRAEQRQVLALRLYRHLAAFVGENLVHMQVEETQNNAALWTLYTDAELQQIESRLMAAVPPAEMALCADWMAAALSDRELAGLFGALQQKAPPPAFDALLAIARGRLGDARSAKLARALGLPPVPGLLTV